MDNKEIGHRLFDRRTELKLTLQEIADGIGVASSTIQRYESGNVNKIKLPVINAISRRLGLNPAWVCGKSDIKYDVLPSNAIPVGSMFPVPVYGEVRAGAGGIAVNEILSYQMIDISIVSNIEECFFLNVKGDSMSPKLEEGDMVLVRQMPSVDSGSIGVVIVDGEEGVVKKIIYGNEYIELHSINPYYPPRIFKGVDVLEIFVVGTVVMSLRKFNS